MYIDWESSVWLTETDDGEWLILNWLTQNGNKEVHHKLKLDKDIASEIAMYINQYVD